MIKEEFIAEKATELFLSEMLAKMAAGQLRGEQVVKIHKCVVNVLCKNKTGWDLLACIVDNMHLAYSRVKEVGFEEAIRGLGCPI